MKPFFIVGTGRCGTQLLRNILKMWCNVRIMPETHFIVPLYNRYGTKDITFEQFIEVVDNIYSQGGHKFIHGILADAKKGYDNYKSGFQSFVTERDLSGNIKDFTEAFFEFLYGADFIFGDKTPHYGIHAKIIKDLWPDAKFIHIYRDGIDVAHSMLGHGGFKKLISEDVPPKAIDEYMYGRKMTEPPKRTILIEESLKYWEVAFINIKSSLDELKNKNDFIEVRYEDLLLYPVNEIFRIVSFLEIDYDRRAFKKAVTIPRPFPEKHQVSKLERKEYEKNFEMVRSTMTQLGYPYDSAIQRSFREQVQEMYRGRYAYFLNYKKKLKSTIKRIVGK